MSLFICDFGGGIKCECTMADEPPNKGGAHVLKMEWTGKPTPKLIRPYIAWMNSVNQSLADKWGVRLMHIFQTKPRWEDGETWVYSPGEKPKLLPRQLES